MSAAIKRTTGTEAYDLIFPDHLAMLPTVNQETMRRSMANSRWVWIGSEGSKILCVWGLIPPSLLSDRAYLWLFTTEHMREHVFLFVRYSQRAVREMLQVYPVIVGHAQVGADRSIRWLRWLGAQFGDPQGQLIPFEIRAP